MTPNSTTAPVLTREIEDSKGSEWLVNVPVLTDVCAPTPVHVGTPDVGLKAAPSYGSLQLASLLEYVQEAERLGKKSAHHLPTSSTFCAWEHEISRLPGLSLNLKDGLWLRLERLQESSAPDPEEAVKDQTDFSTPRDTTDKGSDQDLGLCALKLWLKGSNDPSKEPSLGMSRTDLDGQDQSFETLVELDKKQLLKAFKDYMVAWRKWAAVESRRRLSMGLYARLFSLEQSLEAETTVAPLDLIWGVGIAAWRQDVKTPTRYPLITKAVEISLDIETLALTIRPREAEPRLEMDAFAETGNTGVAHVERLSRALMQHESFDFSPFSNSATAPILRAAVTHLDAKGRYLPEDLQWAQGPRKPGECEEHLSVSDGWVIFTRKRGSNFLIDDLQRLRSAVLIEKPPAGAQCLVVSQAEEQVSAKTAPYRGLSSGPAPTLSGGTKQGAESTAGRVRELYFPKPYNDEQMNIIERLDRYSGVVVQGPPGTGKTHTIANVISHYLATGRTVLVTSKGEPALAVLREHIPEGIRDLTVSLLTNERDGMKQFEAAIARISEEVGRLDEAELAKQVIDNEQAIDDAHCEMATIDTRLARAALAQTEKIMFMGKPMSADEMAQMVVDGQNDHGWMEPIEWANQAHDEVEDEVMTEAFAARSRLGLEINAAHPAVDIRGLPAVEDMRRLNNELFEIADLEQAIDLCIGRKINDGIELKEIQFFISQMKQAQDKYLCGPPSLRTPWAARVFEFMVTSANKDWEVLEALVQTIDVLTKRRTTFLSAPVRLPQVPHELRGLFEEAINLFAKGKNPFTFWSYKHKAVKSLVKSIGVPTKVPQEISEWIHVADYMDFLDKVEETQARLTEISNGLNLPKLEVSGVSGNLLEISIAFKQVQLLAKFIEPLRLQNEQRRAIFTDGLQAWVHASSWTEVIHHAKLQEKLMELLPAANQAALLQLWANSQPEPLKSMCLTFFSVQLGNGVLSHEQMGRLWLPFVTLAGELHQNFNDIKVIKKAAEQIRTAGALRWAACLEKKPAESGLDPCHKSDWRAAWEWSRACSWLGAMASRAELQRLHAQRRDCEQRLAMAYEKAIESKTWKGLLTNATPAVRSALNAYMNAVRMLGKGTGVRAARYRKEARAAMAKAYKAVPCWIMPHWRISEALPSELGSFDLVILDEGSQSDLWALPALLRGKKVMVVGDDQQVSPDGIGLDEEKIQELCRRYLDGQAYGAEMTPEKSVYDLARVAYAGSQVMLREHFRCVPSIIEFSNREFYNGSIRALRTPKGSERVDPPLVDVRVLNGYREPASKINKPEARAIVEQIKLICSDASMKGKTIGVVSLLGAEQAQLIDIMVRQEMDPRTVIERQITCGDARTFQGKERSIMMLSMVVDRRSAVSATRREFQQRYNVAASRARDQMWLFRSVDLADLNPLDLRARLITHFQRPLADEIETREANMKRCESGFEIDMFEAITALGYRVRTQVNVGSYRIDMVVEGSQDARLAIECDGDRYHGPDRWLADSRRQRVLERAGWTFWRCFASAFKLKRSECLQDLVQTLSGMGVLPISGLCAMHPVGTSSYREITAELKKLDQF